MKKCQVEMMNLKLNWMQRKCKRHQGASRIFAMHIFFAIIAKVTMNRKNLNFSINCFFAMIAKFTA